MPPGRANAGLRGQALATFAVILATCAVRAGAAGLYGCVADGPDKHHLVLSGEVVAGETYECKTADGTPLPSGFTCASGGGNACPCLPSIAYANAELATMLQPLDVYYQSGSAGT